MLSDGTADNDRWKEDHGREFTPSIAESRPACARIDPLETVSFKQVPFSAAQPYGEIEWITGLHEDRIDRALF